MTRKQTEDLDPWQPEEDRQKLQRGKEDEERTAGKNPQRRKQQRRFGTDELFGATESGF
jgi:hypothetical protein